MHWDTIQPTYARDDVGADTRMTSVGVAMPASYTVWWGDTRRQPSHPVPIPMDMIEDRMVESESESESQAKTGNAVSMLFRFFFYHHHSFIKAKEPGVVATATTMHDKSPFLTRFSSRVETNRHEIRM